MPSPIVLIGFAAVTASVGIVLAIVFSGFARPSRLSSVTVAPGGAAPAGGPSLAARISPVLPRAYRAMLDRTLTLAGRPAGWTVGRILTAKAALAGVTLLLAFTWISADPVPFRVVLGVLLVALGFFTPELLLYSRALERQEKIELALPDTLDQMTITVEAGLGFEAAMSKAATSGNGPLADELLRTVQDMTLGRSRRDAYQAITERTSSTDLRRFTRAVLQADAYGIPLADVLRVQAGEMRLKRRQRAEEKAMKVPVKVLFPLVFCILPVLFIVLLTPAVLSALAAFS